VTIPADACWVAWVRVASAPDAVPDYQIVEALSRHGWFGVRGGRPASGCPRGSQWRPYPATWRDEATPPRWMRVNLWVDANGECWEPRFGSNQGGLGVFREETAVAQVALPYGHEFRTERRPPAVVRFVVDGVDLVRVEDEQDFISAVRLVLTQTP
jgi:hypothetical protein